MAWPTAEDVDEALALLSGVLEAWSVFAERNRYVTSEGLEDARAQNEKALAVLCRATRPRGLYRAKEAAAVLGTNSSNLKEGRMRGLPEPAYVFPRPSVTHPDRTERFWWADEIDELAEQRRAERERTGV